MNKSFLYFLIIFSLFGCATSKKDLVTGRITKNDFSIKEDIYLGKIIMNYELEAFKNSNISVDSKSNSKQLVLLNQIVKQIANVSHYPNFR